MSSTVPPSAVDDPTGAPAPSVAGPAPDQLGAIAELMDAFGSAQLRAEALMKGVAAHHEISISDLRSLYFVREYDTPTPKQISAYLDLSSGATTALTDRMVAAGYLERLAHPTDRRSSVLRLAPAGAAILAEEVQFYLEVFTGVVGAANVPAFTSALRALVSSFELHAARRFGDD